ncbi:MAG TPA: Fic family protein [Thermoanaerobaculia bacterium]|jgi:Fic family protein|nr:Fic family protein [Thermoanaerobaculia bacterium]
MATNGAGNVDVRKADAAYRPFPSFAEWRASSRVDEGRWERYAGLLKQRAELTPELLARARDVAKRAAAVDTGALEGLYEVDRGFTFTVALQMAAWESALDAKGARVRSLVESQMGAYDFVLDFATRATPIAEVWIRTLHEVMCKGQETYAVYTEIGLQEQALPLGEYKALPNHVMKSDGVVHSWAPVDLVPAEMQRLCAELRSVDFEAAHPVLQASYAHYAFVSIHPFADGNGRVARALASVYTYRALSVPLVILAEHRTEYRAALEKADAGEYQSFVDFTLDRTLDSIQLVSETLRAAGVPAPIESAAQLKRMYLTQRGYSHAEVDGAAFRVLDAFMTEVKRQAQSLNTSELVIGCSDIPATADVVNPSYRAPITNGPRVALVQLRTAPPAETELLRHVILEVPKDSGAEDDLVLRCVETDDVFQARMSETHPALTGTLQLRLSVFVHGFLGRAVAEVARLASAILRR